MPEIMREQLKERKKVEEKTRKKASTFEERKRE